MKVRFAPQAVRDLERIADWIAHADPDAATRLFKVLREKAEGLGEMPLAFPVYRGGEALGFRSRVHGSYLILYQVTDHVRIARIVHGVRDRAQLLTELEAE